MLNVPNALTILRVLLVPGFIILLIDHHHGWALFFFVTAGITDGVDGLIARITQQRSTVGAYLDPIADKLLLTSAFVTLAILGLIPSWLTVLVITRDVIISLGFVLLVLIDRKPEIKPTILSKVNTVLQVLTIAIVLYSEMHASFVTLAPFMITFTACTTILTGLHYIYVGTRMTNDTTSTTV